LTFWKITVFAAGIGLLLHAQAGGAAAAEKAPAGPTSTDASPEPVKSKADSKKDKSAEIHFNRGVELFHDGMLSAALAEFLKSYKEVPQWAVLYNVGVCYYRLGRYEDALKVFEKYMKEGGDEIPADRRVAVEKMKIKMAASYGSLVIDYKLPGVLVTIDGKETRETPVKDPIPLAAGIHSVFLFREGHYPVLMEVSVASGEETVLPVKMRLMPIMEAWMTDTGRLKYLHEREKIGKLETAMWVTLGASVALGMTTVMAGSMTYKLKEEQDSEMLACGPITSEDDCPRAYDLKDKGTKWKWATNGLAAATGAMILATITLWAVRKARMKKLQEDIPLEVYAGLRLNLGISPAALTITW
jgi:hypothetical protein